MNDLKRISVIAIVLIVALRLAIGWQFLYEGLWKYETMATPTPWSAEGYLKNAQGPFRDTFRAMTGDPDDLGWLDYDAMSAKWDRWRDRFIAHYGLDEKQQEALNRLLEGAPAHAVALPQLPASVDLPKAVTYDASRKLLVVQGKTPLLPSEAQAMKDDVAVVALADGGFARRGPDGEALRNEEEAPVPPDAADLAFFKAVDSLFARSSKLGFRQKLAASLKGDPDRVGVIGRFENARLDMAMGTVTTAEEAAANNVHYGEIQVYRDLLAEHARLLSQAKQTGLDYQFDHADRIWAKLQSKRSELVLPVRGLESSLKEEARRLLSSDQFARGPLPPEDGPLTRANQRSMWGLLILGGLLLVGLCTRLAAVAGAIMVFSFYLVIPPWPGVPEAPGPEHSLVVNKNLIESIALLGIAALPTGSWFGLDGLFRWVWRKVRG